MPSKTFPLDLSNMAINPDLITSVVKVTRAEGVTNRADPTAWVSYTLRILESHPLFNISITLQEAFGEVVARVHVHGVEVMFVSSAINEEFHADVVALYERL